MTSFRLLARQSRRGADVPGLPNRSRDTSNVSQIRNCVARTDSIGVQCVFVHGGAICLEQ
jgi:hypothetical protein